MPRAAVDETGDFVRRPRRGSAAASGTRRPASDRPRRPAAAPSHPPLPRASARATGQARGRAWRHRPRTGQPLSLVTPPAGPVRPATRRRASCRALRAPRSAAPCRRAAQARCAHLGRQPRKRPARAVAMAMAIRRPQRPASPRHCAPPAPATSPRRPARHPPCQGGHRGAGCGGPADENSAAPCPPRSCCPTPA